MRLGQTSAIYFVSRFVGSVLGFLGTIYFTRILGEEVYGFYALTIALVFWLGIVKNVGVGGAIVKRMSEGEEPDAYFTAGLIIKTILTAVIAVCVLVFDNLVNSYIGRPVSELVVLLLIVTVVMEMVDSTLKGTHRVHIYAPLNMAKMGVRSAIMILLVFFGWSLTGMVVGHATGTIIIAVIGLWFVKPNFVVPRWRHFTQLYDFAKYAWLGSIRKRSFDDVDILVLGLFVSAGLTGIYAVTYSLAKFLDIFGTAIKETLFPEMSKQSAQEDSGMIVTLTNDALMFAGLFLIPGLVGATIIGDRLMRIYGPGFVAGDQILVILIAALLVYTYTKQLLNTLSAIDRPDLAFRANGALIVTNIILNIVLVWQFGWFGAAIATVLSALVGFTLSLYYVRKLIEVRFPYSEIGLQITAALIMGLVVSVLRTLGETSPVATYNEVFVILLVGAGAIMYFFALFVISSRFRTTVIDNLPDKLIASRI